MVSLAAGGISCDLPGASHFDMLLQVVMLLDCGMKGKLICCLFVGFVVAGLVLDACILYGVSCAPRRQ